MRRVLLLNPPGQRYYMRDYYCGKISKAAYYYHPVDFIILSAILSGTFEVSVMDCISERINPDKAFSSIEKMCPGIIIFLTASVSMDEDFSFLSKVKGNTGSIMVGLGDIFLDYGRQVLQRHDFIDAALLDFTTDDIVKFLNDRKSFYQNIIYRNGDNIEVRQECHKSDSFLISRPRHELFRNDRYVFPFVREKTFATVLTDFGCPFRCNYCAVNRFGYKQRPIFSVIEELKFLNRIGIKELVFKDQTFAAHPQRALSLCREILKQNINVCWTCFSRVDLMDKELLSAMKEAGCHTVILGVESLNQQMLSFCSRNISIDITRGTFNLCADLGIETVATFILGLPGDTKESIEKTIIFARMLECDYASFNIFTPAYGTKIRDDMIKDGRIQDEFCFMDSGISYPLTGTGSLGPKQVWFLRKKAVISFYFRPGYILKKIMRLHSWFQIKNIFRQMMGIIKSL